MGTVESGRGVTSEHATVAAAQAGDQSAFTALAERHRRELQVHCYRMLGSFDDSEDLVQETFLRAWRKRESFRGDASFRAWLYRIATNACLDFLARHQNRVLSAEASEPHASGASANPPHITWLQPYPDRLLEQIAPRDTEPDAKVVTRETIELAFLVAMQFLPAKQRAALILRDVLDWSAKETADLLEMSVPAVNSALQRARATLREHRPTSQDEWAPSVEASEEERSLLLRYVDATERCDTGALTDLLREDVRFSMPPEPGTWTGRDAVVQVWVDGGFGSESFRDFRCIITQANRMPAVACYLRQSGDAAYRPLALDMLRIEGGKVAEVTTFSLERLVEPLGLPPTL